MEHRDDCQLLTVPTYGLCTCDMDERCAMRFTVRGPNWQKDCPQCVGSKFTCDKHYKPYK